MSETVPPGRLEQVWAEHLKGEFETKDVEATLATMVEDAYVNHMPVNTGGRGKAALRRFWVISSPVSGSIGTTPPYCGKSAC